MKQVLAFLVPAAFGLAFLAGCSEKGGGPPSASQPASGKAGHHGEAGHSEHGHKPGQFGGIIVSIGSDSYHAEAVFEKGGVLKLYTLGQDESKVMEIDAQTLKAYAKEEGGTESEEFELKAQSQTGDRPGKTSLFVGTLPKNLTGKRVEVTVVNLRIGTERFRVGFKSAQEVSHGGAGMPTKVGDAEERKLYLTAGGKYTDADIKANGNQTASQKFKGLRAEHDLKPKPGDRICPVTLTKAHTKFSWVIGGKTYQFCCPPCVDEFVALAKEQPDEVKDPSEYAK